MGWLLQVLLLLLTTIFALTNEDFTKLLEPFRCANFTQWQQGSVRLFANISCNGQAELKLDLGEHKANEVEIDFGDGTNFLTKNYMPGINDSFTHVYQTWRNYKLVIKLKRNLDSTFKPVATFDNIFPEAGVEPACDVFAILIDKRKQFALYDTVTLVIFFNGTASDNTSASIDWGNKERQEISNWVSVLPNWILQYHSTICCAALRQQEYETVGDYQIVIAISKVSQGYDLCTGNFTINIHVSALALIVGKVWLNISEHGNDLDDVINGRINVEVGVQNSHPGLRVSLDYGDGSASKYLELKLCAEDNDPFCMTGFDMHHYIGPGVYQLAAYVSSANGGPGSEYLGAMEHISVERLCRGLSVMTKGAGPNRNYIMKFEKHRDVFLSVSVPAECTISRHERNTFKIHWLAYRLLTRNSEPTGEDLLSLLPNVSVNDFVLHLPGNSLDYGTYLFHVQVERFDRSSQKLTDRSADELWLAIVPSQFIVRLLASKDKYYLQETVVLEASVDTSFGAVSGPDQQDNGTAEGPTQFIWWCGRNRSILNPHTLTDIIQPCITSGAELLETSSVLNLSANTLLYTSLPELYCFRVMAKVGGLRNSSSPVCVELVASAFLNLVVGCLACNERASSVLDLNFTCTNCKSSEALTMSWLIANTESGANQTLEWTELTNATWVMFSVAYNTLETILSASPFYSITLSARALDGTEGQATYNLSIFRLGDKFLAHIGALTSLAIRNFISLPWYFIVIFAFVRSDASE